MNTDSEYEVKLFRLATDVQSEILKALEFYNNNATMVDKILLERARRDVSVVFITHKMHDTANNKEIIKMDTHETLYRTNVRNAITAFDDFLRNLLDNHKDNQIIKNIINTFNTYMKF